MTTIYGFDPYAGFLHQLFFQRKSLVCDLMEPFRYIIDRRIRKLHDQNQVVPEDFYFQEGKCQIGFEAAKKYTKFFLKDILAEKENIFKWCQEFYRELVSRHAVDNI